MKIISRINYLVAAVLINGAQAVVLSASVSITALPITQAPAQAQSSEAVDKVAKSITVRIEGATQGSGFLIARDDNTYTVLTAWHVLKSHKEGEELGIYTADGQVHSHIPESIRRIGNYDLAKVTFISSSSYQVGIPELHTRVSREDELVASGYPLDSGGEMVANTGELIAYASMGINQGYQLLYTNSTRPGMSGGPLINQQGRVIGVHGRGEKSIRNSRGEVEIVKTGINQGVPIRFYLNSLGKTTNLEDLSPEPSTSSDYLILAFDSLWEYGTGQTVERLARIGLDLDKEKDKRVHSAGWWLIGKAQSKMGQSSKAISSFNRSIEYMPDNFLAFHERGRAYASINKPKMALQDFSRSISMNHKYTGHYIDRAFLYIDLGKYRLAHKDLSDASELEPQNPEHLLNRGLASLRLGDYSEACQDIKRADEMGMNYAHSVLLKLRVTPEVTPFCS